MMEELKENFTFKSLSEEESYNQTDNTNESENVSSKCVFARWLKPASVNELKFVSKDVLLIHVEKTLIFYDTNTQKEDILIVGSKSTPGSGADDNLYLEGIGCFDCCEIDLLALAEHPPISKVVICLYPALKVLATLIDSSCSSPYKSILFLRLEYLIGLRDYPTFDLIVWAWRIGEKLLVVDTGFIQPNQYLNLSAITAAAGRNDVYLSQTEHDVGCKLQLWTLFVSCKTVYAERTRVELPSDASPSGCWTPYGWYVFCDSLANVYRVQPGAPEPETVVATTADPISAKRGNGGGPGALVCPSKQGFVLYAVNQDNRLTCFKDTRGIFTKIWTIVVDYILQCMTAVKNDVYGWSDEGTLLRLTQKKQQILKVYGLKIKYFTFIKPTDEMVATINHANTLQVWDASTGEFKSKMKLNGTATDLCSNPFYHYIAITFKNGKMELLRTVPKVNKIECIAKIVLCDEDLSSIKFFSDGNICNVTSFPTGRFYYISITLGQKCAVLRKHQLGKHVIDIDIVDNKKSSFLTVLYSDLNNDENAGNNILIFDILFNIVFKLNDIQNYYTSIFKWSSYSIPSALNIAFTVLHSKSIHLMTIDIVKENMLNLQTIPLDHQLKCIKTYTNGNHSITFSPDGSYNIYEFDDDGQWKKMIMVNCSHWQSGGLIAAQIDDNANNILTLSYQGNFICTSIKGTLNRNRRIDNTNFQIIEDNFETKGIGFENGPESPKRMTWEMINQQNKLNETIVAYSNQKQQIIQHFEKIKTELQHLLETNVNGPEDIKIDIEEFDLNVDYRLNFREKCKLERKEYEVKILSDINKFKMETENIIKEKWETLFIKPKSIYCLKNIYKVDNFPISIIDQDIIKKANKIIEKRILIGDMSEQISSIEDTLSKNDFEILDVESNLLESDDKQSNDLSMTGSISYEFIETIGTLNSQYNYHKLEMAEDEIILLKLMVNKLKHKFNQLFDDLFTEKQRQLDNLKEYNERLRVIETELRLACKIEPTEPLPIDYEWNKYEKIEELLHVNDNEVPVELYRNNILSSKEMSKDVNSSTEKINNESVNLNNYRQRALVFMMDGVLEKRWEDELKKDVPKPQCIMLNKNPEDFTKDDLKAIDEYKKLTLTLNDERIKYKNILEEEKIKIHHHIAQIIEKFDHNVFMLFQLRLKYNSAIDQENLKMLRLSKMLSDSDQRKHQIKQHDEKILELRETITGIEQVITETNKKIAKSEPNSLLNTIETLNHKNNILNKRFKSEFPSKLIYEQALIAYNRRPKIQGNTNYSSILGYQFVNTILDPTDDKLQLLTSEFVKYLDTLRVYDDYKYVDDYKLNMDKETWHKVCNFRRMKIESEFKISTYQKDTTDKDNLLDSLKRNKEDKEVMIEKLKMSIIKLENQDLYYEDNPEIQLVVTQGNIEIVLTGHFSDFENTTLISKNTIDEVNAEIKKMGYTKIDALSNLLKFKRKCRFLKWEHDILKKHKIPLYKFRFDLITSMKITENVLNYLKFKMKGINNAEQAEQNVDKELAAIKFTYTKQKEKLNEKLNEMFKTVRDTKNKNKKADEDIDQMTCELTELKCLIDYGLNDKLIRHSSEKMKNIMKFTQINTKVLELHKEIEALQIELELLLLKTFPTLYTNFSKNTKIIK
ncbi:cilia- and flagella-associated protein 43 isoform X1 [Rhopalosiphum padi]|uniref:cilia- and flagella-associated protein 43 isoform X1 n=2 Tax=Rhopalosiphum padi TaxID=40932 RepID=UPI00298DAC26|nr:cilia- and flagella-associated protein 43 isoform X1 [Rhopalosiphum padi]